MEGCQGAGEGEEGLQEVHRHPVALLQCEELQAGEGVVEEDLLSGWYRTPGT